VQKTLIPGLNREVSQLGLGSMIFHPDRKALVFELIDAWRARGGNLIDTAACYAGGQSERAIGLYLQEVGGREDLVILDKAFDNAETLVPEAISAGIEGNLERLGTNYLDLFLFHRDNEKVSVQEIVDAMHFEVLAGRVRAWGGSNWTVPRIWEANSYAAITGKTPMSVSSPHVCLATAVEPFWAGCTQAYSADLRWYREKGIPVLAWSSQGRGFFLEGSGPEDTNADLRRVYGREDNYEKLERVRQLAAEKGLAPVQIALAYVLSLDAPIIALVGPATVGEIDSSVDASSLRLTPDEMAWLELRA
jgi:aryl-alcohol dehydrogenase-like predicted oxidoreductase